MKEIRLSGFADEIDSSLERQLAVLKKLNMRFVEMRGVNGRNLTTYTLEEAADIARQLADAGVSLSAVGSPIGKINITDKFEPHFSLFCHTVKLAKLLGAPYIRMFSFYIPEDGCPEDYTDEVLRRLRRMVDYAKSEGVVLLHENEKEIYGDTALRCKVLMDELGCENFRAVFDFANFVQCGQDTWQAYELLKPHIAYIHVKDALLSDGSVVPPGSGDGQLERILADLLKCGYNGFLSLEPHLSDFTGFGALEKGEQQGWRKLSGEDAFSLAHKSLCDILLRAGVPLTGVEKEGTGG